MLCQDDVNYRRFQYLGQKIENIWIIQDKYEKGEKNIKLTGKFILLGHSLNVTSGNIGNNKSEFEKQTSYSDGVNRSRQKLNLGQN